MNDRRVGISCLFVVLGILSGACGTLQLGVESAPVEDATPLPVSTPELTPTPALERFSSDRLGICFSYPEGYTQMPYNDAVEIVAPGPVPGSDELGLFWLEISDAQDRTAEGVADQERSYVAGLDPGRWTVMLGGEQALVLDGMPGQNLVRRVYIVHQGALYILTFTPTRSANEAAVGQMESLYAAVTGTWAWSACSDGE